MALSNTRVTMRPVRTPLTCEVAPVGADLDFDPLDGGRLMVWLGNKLAVASQGAVAAWPDRSGYGNHAQQPTAGNRPLNVQGAVNGRQVRRFDGTDDTLNLAAFTWGDMVSGEATRVVVFKPTNQNWASTAGAARFWNLGLGSTNQRFYSGVGTSYSATTRLGMNVAATLFTGILTLETATFTLVFQQRRGAIGGSVRQWKSNLTPNDINTVFTGGGTPLGATTAYIGGDVNGYAQMDLPEFLQYARQLLQSELLRHARRARRLYGIPVAA